MGRNRQGLQSALEAFAGEHVNNVLDALACELHNEGYALSGNTAENDEEWFARWLYTVSANRGYHGRTAWEMLEPYEQKLWRALAQLSIECLPFLMERMASRYISAAEAIRVLEKGTRWDDRPFALDLSRIFNTAFSEDKPSK